jgi:hypothetical protein
MSATITRAEAEEIKQAISDAEAGHASMGALARAHDVCERAGAVKTLEVVRSHIRGCEPALGNQSFFRSIAAGLIAGSIVALTVGRLR